MYGLLLQWGDEPDNKDYRSLGEYYKQNLETG